MPNTFAAVLFDFSATLFDPYRVVTGPGLAEHARKRGVSLDGATAATQCARILARAETAVGLAVQNGTDLSSEHYRKAWSQVALSVPGVDQPVADAFYDCLVDPARWRPYADTGVMLAALCHAGIRVGVVSNCRWDLRAIFAYHGLADLVDTYVLSCEQGREKPDPWMFRYACEQLGVRPAAALMVGDDPQTDAGALAAGIAVYLLPPPVPGERIRGLSALIGVACGGAGLTSSSAPPLCNFGAIV